MPVCGLSAIQKLTPTVTPQADAHLNEKSGGMSASYIDLSVKTPTHHRPSRWTHLSLKWAISFIPSLWHSPTKKRTCKSSYHYKESGIGKLLHARDWVTSYVLAGSLSSQQPTKLGLSLYGILHMSLHIGEDFAVISTVRAPDSSASRALTFQLQYTITTSNTLDGTLQKQN